MTTIAQLGIKIDTGGTVASAADDLDRVAASASKAEEAGTATGTAFGAAGAKFEEFAVHAQRHILMMAGANRETIAFAHVISELGPAVLLGAAAIAVLAIAAAKGSAEQANFTKALAATGNQIGLTTGQLQTMAAHAGDAAGTTHEAAQAIATLVQSGNVGADSLGKFAAIAVQAQKVLGQTYADTAKNLSALADSPLQASEALQKQFAFLTIAEYDQIAALERNGQVVEAARIAQNAYADAVSKQTAQVKGSLSGIPGLWDSIKSHAAEAWSAMLNIGRSQAPQDELAALLNQQGARPGVGRSPGRGGQNQHDQRVKELQDEIAGQNAAAEAQKKQNDAVDEHIRKVAVDAAQVQAAAAISKASYQAQLADIQRLQTGGTSDIANQTAILDAQRQGRLISDAEYYAKRRDLIEADSELQIKALQQENSAVAEEIVIAQKRANAEKQNATDPAAQVAIQAKADTDRISLQTKIADNDAAIAEKRKKNAADLTTLETNEYAETQQKSAQYILAARAVDTYVASLKRRYDIELSTLGLGAQETQRLQAIAAIQDEFAKREEQLRSSLTRKDINQDQFDQQLQLERQGLTQSLKNYDDYYTALQKKQSDWTVGVRQAFSDYIATSKNAAQQFKDAVAGGFTKAEDAIAQFATTGKFDFTSLANSILADLVRIETRVLISKALQSIFGAFLGGASSSVGASTYSDNGLSGSTAGYAASGGNINGPTIVGEAGPELFVPGGSGTVIPNGAWQGGGSGVTIVNNNNFGSGANVAEISAELDRRDEQITANIQQNIHRGRWDPVFAR